MNIAPLLRMLQDKLPLNKMSLSREDLDKIRFAGLTTDTTSYMFGHFKLPGNDTNDLVNNLDYQPDHKKTTISMSHVKRVYKHSEARVLICSKWEYEYSLNQEVKKEIFKLANSANDLAKKKKGPQ